MERLKNRQLFEDYSQTMATVLLEENEYPWEILPLIHDFILEIGIVLSKKDYTKVGDNVWIAKTATVAKTATINGPCIIGANTEVRPGAFIRGNALVGENCVVGNSTELKNVILFNNVQVPHYNYVGDSILGYKAHMGAGSITSNIKADKKQVTIKLGEQKVETKLRKMGAILGDGVDVGCNSVMNPGSVIGKHTNLYPLSMVRGYVPEQSVYKTQGEIAKKY